jgi:hypothetical protein
MREGSNSAGTRQRSTNLGGVLPTVTAQRYVTPLREGGSLPGIVEANDLGTYVVKFRGAGQGRKTLVAEIIAGELGRRLDLPVPDLVLVDLDPGIARCEPDQEIQDLLAASAGLNLGMDFLPGSLGVDPGTTAVDATLASRILWFDALIGNVDRSWRNPNLLLWHGDVWMIDHGASLIFHHSWGRNPEARAAAAARPYDASDHILAPFASELPAADRDLAPRVTEAVLREVVDLVPDEWLADEPGFTGVDEVRDAYVRHLLTRASTPRAWLPELAA